jgi:hypothetical protein
MSLAGLVALLGDIANKSPAIECSWLSLFPHAGSSQSSRILNLD